MATAISRKRGDMAVAEQQVRPESERQVRGQEDHREVRRHEADHPGARCLPVVSDLLRYAESRQRAQRQPGRQRDGPLTLHALVATIGLSKADEAQAERNTGTTLNRWSETQRSHRRERLVSGGFPLLAIMSDDAAPDLDVPFEYGLAGRLDGFAALVGGHGGSGAAPAWAAVNRC